MNKANVNSLRQDVQWTDISKDINQKLKTSTFGCGTIKIGSFKDSTNLFS